MAKDKIWYVEFPTYQYNEDVKQLAKKNGLKIIDAQFDAGDGEKDVPKLTKIGDKQVKDVSKLIANVDKLKEKGLKELAEHFEIEFVSIEETLPLIKERIEKAE